MTNLTNALTQVSNEVERIMESGRNARLLSVDIHQHEQERGCLEAICEFKSGDLQGVTFTDAHRWSRARRVELELSFRFAGAMKAAMCEVFDA